MMHEVKIRKFTDGNIFWSWDNREGLCGDVDPVRLVDNRWLMGAGGPQSVCDVQVQIEQTFEVPDSDLVDALNGKANPDCLISEEPVGFIEHKGNFVSLESAAWRQFVSPEKWNQADQEFNAARSRLK